MRYRWVVLGAFFLALLYGILFVFRENWPAMREGGEAVIVRPLPGEEVSSPLWVAGSAAHPDRELRVRLVAEDRKVLAERTMRVSRVGLTEFETCLEYGLLAAPVAARVEVVAPRENGGEVLASVPVILK